MLTLAGARLQPSILHRALVLAAKAALALHQLLEADARVEDVERHDGDDDHDALEADEHRLVLHEGSGPALAQLGDAEDAAPEDADGAERQRAEEALEEPRVADGGHAGGLVEGGVAEAPVPPPGVEGEVGRAEHEHEHREDLERQPRDHDVVAGLDRLVVVRGYGCHGASDGLQDQR